MKKYTICRETYKTVIAENKLDALKKFGKEKVYLEKLVFVKNKKEA